MGGGIHPCCMSRKIVNSSTIVSEALSRHTAFRAHLPKAQLKPPPESHSDETI